MPDESQPSGPSDGRPRKQRSRQPRRLLDTFRTLAFWIWLGILVVNYLVVNVFLAPRQQHQVTISYTEFKQQVAANNVTTVTSEGDTITGVTGKPISGQANGSSAVANHFVTQRPAFDDNGLEPLLEEHAVTIDATVPSSGNTLLIILLSVVPALLLLPASST